jgi:phosphatidylglycerol---prolipoprotein diacylglyceryl transferase
MYPILLHWHDVTIYSYPLFMGLAWGVAYQLTRWLLLNQKIVSRGLIGLFIGSFISAWLGAKALFLLHSAGGNLQTYLGSPQFWLGGGFVFYGGLLWASAFVFTYSYFLQKFDHKALHLLIPGLLTGHAIGRVGCFLAGCCFGGACTLPWAINLLDEMRHPVQLYEAASLLILAALTLYLILRVKSSPFKVISLYFALYALIRFILEYFRGDSIRGVYTFALSTSQYISIAMIIMILLISLHRKIRL